MTSFYLVRHGEPHYDYAEEHRLKGHSRDLVPLTEHGVAQDETRSWEPRSAVRRRALNVLRRHLHTECALVACHAGVIEALAGQNLPYGGVCQVELNP